MLTCKFTKISKNVTKNICIINTLGNISNNLKYILDKQGLPAKFYNSAYVFGTSLANEMVISKRNVQENMNEVISNFVEKFIIEWERTIKENGKKLTHFCLI